MAEAVGKNTTERNKMIAAAVLGLVALIALYLAFGRSFFGSSTPSVTVKISPTPKPGVSPGAGNDNKPLPTAGEQDFTYQTTPVDYRPGSSNAPDPGRNIFAFFEPPPPTPYSPTPLPPMPTQIPATPAPTPPIILTSINPQAIYAGSAGFRLEANGQFIPADARIYFNQSEMPTVFINDQKVVADIPANLIVQEGPRQIILQTPDGKLYSNQLMWTVQAPPRPSNFQYVGMVGRKRYNNDTAYFTETGKPTPFTARLNDVIGGRFRLIDISATEVVFEDTSLGFKHHVLISKASTSGITGQPGRPGFNNGGDAPFNPRNNPQGSDIPGIPTNIPRYVPPQQQQGQPKQTPNKNDDVDDNDDGDN